MTLSDFERLESPQDGFPTMLCYSGTAAGEGWLQSLRRDASAILADSQNSGAVLLRGLPLAGADDFDRAIRCFDQPNFTYEESLSNAVRRNCTERVFTANEAPPEVSIFLHHEMAQTPIYPSKLFFHCEIAADEGGATPLCRSDRLLRALAESEPDFVRLCREKGVRYSNTMPARDDDQSGQGRSWRSTLSVQDRAAAEARLAKLGYDWQWLEHDELRVTTPVLPAIRQLDDGREVFFNQLIAAHRGWKDKRNASHKAIRFGDDSELPDAAMARASELGDELSVDLDWRPGDIALVDNFLVMHGRRPFSGKRRVLASLVA